jgi:HEAT repeat protein
VEAAYALTRLGAESGPASLRRLAAEGGPLDLGRLKAAGYLARLGDHRGRQIVADGLASAYRPIRMTACRQLYFFGAGALEEFRTALADPDDDVRWQALVQLRLLREPATRPLLEEYAGRAGDGLAATAQRILDEWAADRQEPGPE